MNKYHVLSDIISFFKLTDLNCLCYKLLLDLSWVCKMSSVLFTIQLPFYRPIILHMILDAAAAKKLISVTNKWSVHILHCKYIICIKLLDLHSCITWAYIHVLLPLNYKRPSYNIIYNFLKTSLVVSVLNLQSN